MIKVSVIVPVYNMENYLGQCLDSLINQTLSEIEIICVNDGSTDSSAEILSSYQQRYPDIIKCISQDNSGQSIARNNGLKQAAGEYVYFMDSDDILLATAMEELYAVCMEKKLDILFFSGESFYESTELAKSRADFSGRYLRKGNYTEVLSGKQLLCELVKNRDYIVSACLNMVRRDLLLAHKLHFEEGIIHEDNLFCFEAMIHAERAFCVNEIYFYRRVRESSTMTVGESNRNLTGYWRCYVRDLDIIRNESWSEEVEDALQAVLIGLINNVRHIYGLLSSEERDIFMSNCSTYERQLFISNITAGFNELDRQKHAYSRELDKLRSESKRKIDELQQHLDNVHASVSFRIGRAVTMIPRKLRTFIRVLKNDGFKRVIDILKAKLA